MNPHGEHVANLQADALLDEIARKIDASCAEILADARREAEAIRLRAREKARRQTRRAVAEMRSTSRRRIAQLRAELETERGRRLAEQAMLVLGHAWPALGEAISERWNDRSARGAWIAAQIDMATSRFGSRPWVIRHPATWPAADVQALREALALACVSAADLQPDVDLAIGLVIEVDGARLDTSPTALLADRPAVQALLLAAIAKAAPEAPVHE